jgi:hypothetical protein
MAFLSVPMCFREQHHTDFWNAFILVAAPPRCGKWFSYRHGWLAE